MADPVPLCIDLDGTLTCSDTLLETFLILVKKDPFCLWRLPLWLSAGRANLKRNLTDRASLDIPTLPWHPELLAWLEEERRLGRKLVLVTAADGRIARAVAEHLGLFDEVVASGGNLNVSGENKARQLIERFGEHGFDYVGNERADLPVWAQSRKAIIISHSSGLEQRARELCEVAMVLRPLKAGPWAWLRALRVHQWAKNLLIIVPLMGAHQWHDTQKLVATALALAAFCIGASSVYMLNDLLDLEADRHHPTKRHRPFASGSLPLWQGLAGAPLLLLASILVSFLLPWKFGVTFASYYVLTFLYSLRLKRVEILDVLTLAALYSIRVLAGGYAAQVLVSDWLLVFSVFVFLSLAFVKRFTELQMMPGEKGASLKGRGYQLGDLQLIGSMGVCSGYLAILVLALYITSPAVTTLYHNPAALWFVCPVLLYWISRVWLLAHRGALHDDPIVFALKDRQSWLLCFLLVAIGVIAQPN